MEQTKWYNIINYENLLENRYEKEYETDEEEIKITKVVSNKFSINNQKILADINQYLLINTFDKYTSLELLNMQHILSTYINKFIIKKNNDFNFILKNLHWLKNVSKFLLKRIGQKEITNTNNKNKILRSSYKFCKYNNNCTYNYKYKNKACYSDHYVHNKIYYDLSTLINYIEKNNEIIINKELTTCINTINFVIKHMYKELSNLCLYSKKEDYEKFHINK